MEASLRKASLEVPKCYLSSGDLVYDPVPRGDSEAQKVEVSCLKLPVCCVSTPNVWNVRIHFEFKQCSRTRSHQPEDDPSSLVCSLGGEETPEFWHGNEAAQAPGWILTLSQSPPCKNCVSFGSQTIKTTDPKELKFPESLVLTEGKGWSLVPSRSDGNTCPTVPTTWQATLQERQEPATVEMGSTTLQPGLLSWASPQYGHTD